MSTIRVSDDIKERLRDLKKDDESFNDLLDRLSRQEKDLDEIAGSLAFLDEDGTLETEMQAAHDELNESLSRRADQ